MNGDSETILTRLSDVERQLSTMTSQDVTVDELLAINVELSMLRWKVETMVARHGRAYEGFPLVEFRPAEAATDEGNSE